MGKRTAEAKETLEVTTAALGNLKKSFELGHIDADNALADQSSLLLAQMAGLAAMQIAAIEEGFDRLIEALHPVAPLTAEQSIPGESALLDMLHEKQKIAKLRERAAQLGRTPSEEDGA